MTKKPSTSLHTPTKVFKSSHSPGILKLSSEEIGWKELAVHVYQEPTEEREGWMDFSEPDTSLVLFTRGVTYLERRYANSPWKGQYIHQGEMFLIPGGSPPTEMRWRSLSPELPQSLRLLLNTELLARTAQEIADCDYTRVALIQNSGFYTYLGTGSIIRYTLHAEQW